MSGSIRLTRGSLAASAPCFLMSDRMWNLLPKPPRADSVRFKNSACTQTHTSRPHLCLMPLCLLMALLISAAAGNRGSQCNHLARAFQRSKSGRISEIHVNSSQPLYPEDKMFQFKKDCDQRISQLAPHMSSVSS